MTVPGIERKDVRGMQHAGIWYRSQYVAELQSSMMRIKVSKAILRDTRPDLQAAARHMLNGRARAVVAMDRSLNREWSREAELCK